MAPVTVLVASTSIPAHTLNATLPVRGLVAAGARVLWCLAPQYAAHARAQGAEPVGPLADDPLAGPGRGVPHGALSGLADVRRLYRDGLLAAVGSQTSQLLELAGRHGVDVLLSDGLMFAAGLAAEVAGLPWVSLGDGPLAAPDPLVPPLGTGLPPLAGAPGRHRNRTVRRVVDATVLRPALEALNRERAARGLWPVADLSAAGVSPLRHLQGCAPGFEFPREVWPQGLRFVGALGPGPGFAPRLPDELRRGSDPRPLALVTQGTLRPDPRELVEPACRGLQQAGFRVLVAGAARPSHVPEPVSWLPRVDLVDALEHTDLLVTNGGWTTVTLALAAGVGVLQCGATEEKPDIGARLERCGAGRAVRLTRPPAWLVARRAQQVLASASRREASARLQREFAELDAAALCAREVLDVAGVAAP